MSNIDWTELEQRMRRIRHLARVALAAAAAERVHRVYEKHWVAAYVEEAKEAIDFAWRVVDGAPIDPTQLARLTQAVKAEVEYLRDEEIDILAGAVTASLRVLETLSQDVGVSALGVARTLGSCVDVAQTAGKLSKTIGAKVAAGEEAAWQDRAIALAEGVGPWNRERFHQLGGDPPAWWVAYEAGAEHLI